MLTVIETLRTLETVFSSLLKSEYKRAIGQKVCVPNPSKLDNYLNGEAHSIQLHHPT